MSNNLSTAPPPSVPVEGKYSTGLVGGILMLVTIIWSSGFVVSNVALRAGFPLMFILLCRFVVGGAFVAAGYRRRIAAGLTAAAVTRGSCLGLVFMLCFYTQMLGLKHSSPSNNAIITCANVVFVPFILWAFHRVRPSGHTFFACCLSLCGIAAVSLDFSAGPSLHRGDALSFVAAVLFALQIVMVGEFSRRMDIVVLVFWEFVSAALLTLVFFAFAGEPLPAIGSGRAWLAVLYLGVVCTGVCFILQAWAMRHLDSARAAVIMSTEALFAAALSVLVGMDVLTWRIAAGAILLTVAVLWPELHGRLSGRGPR